MTIMADGHALESSVIIEDYFAYPRSIDSGAEEHPVSKSINLTFSNEKFAWQGFLHELKAFVQNDLRHEGTYF